MTDLGNLISVKDAAKALGVSVYTVRRLISASQIKSVHIGSRVLVSSVEVERIKREGTGVIRPATI
jgi:excisionase family DNA binding protein